jgi:hypothetical protein
MLLEGEISFLVEEAVLVADYQLVGPGGDGVDEEAEAFGAFRKIEFQFCGVGVGGF